MLGTLVFMGICFSLIPGYEWDSPPGLVFFFFPHLPSYIVRVEPDYHRLSLYLISVLCLFIRWGLGVT